MFKILSKKKKKKKNCRCHNQEFKLVSFNLATFKR